MMSEFCPICGYVVSENRDDGIRDNWLNSPPDMSLKKFEALCNVRILEIGAQIARLEVLRMIWSDRLEKQQTAHVYDGIILEI